MREDGLYVVIMAGGRGTRFWPRSRRSMPKQCLAVAGGRTLVQRTVDRVLPICPVEQVLVVTTAEMVDAVREQLPELPAANLLVEPEGRNTAPCVGWAAVEVGRRGGGGAVMVVLPADHLIADEAEFRDVVTAAAAAARDTGALCTIGVTPSRPETGFGYLQLAGELGAWESRAVLRVECFVEKPDLATAVRYVESGQYLWNAGMFVFTVDVIRDAFRRHLPASWATLEAIRHDPSRIQALYRQLEAISIDYGIMEQATHVITVPGDFGWSDVGSWPALGEHLDTADGGRALAVDVVAVDAQDNVIYAPGKTVALVGVSGLVVVDTPDAILVMPADQAQRVREVIEALEARGASHLL